MKKIVSILVGLMCLFGAQLAKAQGIALRTNLVAAQPYENFFLGLQFTPTHYRVKLDKREEYKNNMHVHNGVAFPVGFNFGYSWPLNSKLNLEACYGAGWMFYNEECNYHPHETRHRMTFTTTNVGLNITYILK